MENEDHKPNTNLLILNDFPLEDTAKTIVVDKSLLVFTLV